MRTLIVGIGALGGTIATRAASAGMPVWLATRSAESARALRSSGLRVSGVGGTATAASIPVAAIEEYRGADKFELILLATKAHEALEIAPFLASLLTSSGTLLPIQNGGVSQILSDRLGGNVVLGGVSNLGATMVEPGVFEQRNAGHLLIGELAGGLSERVANVARALSGAIETRVTPSLRGAVWAKLLLNCSVTTIGAIAAQTMRQYMASYEGKEVFRRSYEEALSVALASGAHPERMIVDPIPPGWQGRAVTGPDHDWIDQIIAAYGDIKPSMLQDFERGRRTEVDFINGYVAQLGKQIGVPTAMNTAITDLVQHRRGADLASSRATRRSAAGGRLSSFSIPEYSKKSRCTSSRTLACCWPDGERTSEST
jgi:2-dehydropantoate 2-reductase